jgi:hypothetical protein
MKGLILSATALLGCAPAHAQTVAVTPTLDTRLRYEHVDQVGLSRTADALTLRIRPGVTATRGSWSALVEADGVLALVDRYNDGLNGRAGYPIVADPENVELNRAQLRYSDARGAATAGRQRLALADERFVGTAPWRQSEQTFDAARVQIGSAKGLSADVTYSWSVRTVNGRDGFGARPTSIGGDNLFALVGYRTPVGMLTGFAYLVNQDAPAVQGYRLSSQTYGARVAGSVPVSGAVTFSYAASYARQADYRDNPNDYSADYWLGEAGLGRGGLSGTLGYEVLGAGRGRSAGAPLASLQTPLASAFKFNGWVGKFTATPTDGLRDLYGVLSHGWKKVGPLDAITLSAAVHRFRSDRLSRSYGDELDLLATFKRGHFAASARFARYRERGFATDTDKGWLQLDWAL